MNNPLFKIKLSFYVLICCIYSYSDHRNLITERERLPIIKQYIILCYITPPLPVACPGISKGGGRKSERQISVLSVRA